MGLGSLPPGGARSAKLLQYRDKLGIIADVVEMLEVD
jgi:hypothetical protein